MHAIRAGLPRTPSSGRWYTAPNQGPGPGGVPAVAVGPRILVCDSAAMVPRRRPSGRHRPDPGLCPTPTAWTAGMNPRERCSADRASDHQARDHSRAGGSNTRPRVGTGRRGCRPRGPGRDQPRLPIPPAGPRLRRTVQSLPRPFRARPVRGRILRGTRPHAGVRETGEIEGLHYAISERLPGESL